MNTKAILPILILFAILFISPVAGATFNNESHDFDASITEYETYNGGRGTMNYAWEGNFWLRFANINYLSGYEDIVVYAKSEWDSSYFNIDDTDIGSGSATADLYIATDYVGAGTIYYNLMYSGATITDVQWWIEIDSLTIPEGVTGTQTINVSYDRDGEINGFGTKRHYYAYQPTPTAYNTPEFVSSNGDQFYTAEYIFYGYASKTTTINITPNDPDAATLFSTNITRGGTSSRVILETDSTEYFDDTSTADYNLTIFEYPIYASVYLESTWLNYTFYDFATGPTAALSGTPTSGDAPLTVTFTDASTGGPTDWYWEFGDGYTSYTQNPAHTYVTPGTYTVVLTAYNSAGSDSEVKVGYITVNNYTATPAVVNGYCLESTDYSFLDGVTVTIWNSTWSDTDTSADGGFYQFTGLAAGQTYYVKGEKTGYSDSPDYGVYTYEAAVTTQHIYLATEGVTVQGKCYDLVTGDLLTGVNVSAVQSAVYHYDTSDAGGNYAITGLASGTAITVDADFSGYTYEEFSFTPEESGPATYDLYLTPDDIIFTGGAIYGQVYDEDTHDAIVSATVTVTNTTTSYDTVTSGTGYYMIDELGGGTYSVSASKSGYVTSSEYSVTITSSTAEEQNIPLSEESSTAGADYPSHHVRFAFVDEYGNVISDLDVVAEPTGEITVPWAWITSLLGYSSTIDIAAETLTGTTGFDGTIAFLMIEEVEYELTLTKDDPEINETLTLYPKDSDYTIRINTGISPITGQMPIYDISISESETTTTFALDYDDSAMNETDALYFVVKDSDGATVSNESVSLSGGIGTEDYAVTNTRGMTYQIGFIANHTTYGTIEEWMDYTCQGSGALFTLGLSAWMRYLIALCSIIVIGGIFSSGSAKMGAVVVPLIGGGIFWYIGWLPAAADTVYLLVCTGILYYMVRRGREVDRGG